MSKLRGIKLVYTNLIKKMWNNLEDTQQNGIRDLLSATENIVLEETVESGRKVEISDDVLKEQMNSIIESLSDADIEQLVQKSPEEILVSNNELLDFILELMTEEERLKFAEILLNELLELIHTEERKEQESLDISGYG